MGIDASEQPAADPGYALSASDGDEHARLSRQSVLHEPFTRRLLTRAGIDTGMRVLDVGCGPGDVSLLVRELVGADGSVVGVERDEQAVVAARERAADAGLQNVEFVCGDFREIELDGGPFDALVGRFVLLYQADPADAVRRAARHVRPGGIVAFAELNLPIGSAHPAKSLMSWPPTHASEQVNEWIYEAFARLGTQPDMGIRLPETYAQAGLEPSPDLETALAFAVGEDAISHTIEFIGSLLPTILDAGIATEEQVDLATLAERMRAGTSSVGRISCWPTAIGAYATKPSKPTASNGGNR
ncbi:MAG: class I SAM-dependent methyltransferase [Solirubrobacteraceae bacterium]